VEGFAELMRKAVRRPPVRKRPLVSKAAKLRRLEEKKQYSLQKQERSKKAPVED